MVYAKAIILLSVGESGGYLPPLRWIIVNYLFYLNQLKLFILFQPTESCEVAPDFRLYIDDCHDWYGFFAEDNVQYDIAWEPLKNESLYNPPFTYQAWEFNTSDELDTMPVLGKTAREHTARIRLFLKSHDVYTTYEIIIHQIFLLARDWSKHVTEYSPKLIYTTQVNSTFRARWLASSEVINQVLFTSEQPKENKMAFATIFSQRKLLFGPLVIQLVWYILK